MSKKPFNLDDLYNKPATGDMQPSQTKERKKPGRKKKDVPSTLHGFRIEDEIWEQFLVYIQMRGGNQNAVVNDVFRDVVEAHKEKIEKFRELMS